MKVVAIVQARMGSIRLPNKVMKPICGVPLIEILLKRLDCAKKVDQIVVATSDDPQNIPLVNHVNSLGYACEQGSENDVLKRYIDVAEKYQAEVVVRVTGDCPLIDPQIVDSCVDEFFNQNVDYLSNTNPPTFPDGLDTSVCTIQALRIASEKATDDYQREHVMPYIRQSNEFLHGSIVNSVNLSSLRWTVDTPEDLEVITNIFTNFYPSFYFSWNSVLELQHEKPWLFTANSHLSRNEGAVLGTGQKLWIELSESFLVEICFYLNAPRCFCLPNGLPISVNLPVARFGIWTAMSLLICRLWVSVQIHLATLIQKLTRQLYKLFKQVI